MQLVRIFSSKSKDFPGGKKKLHRVATRMFFFSLFSFSISWCNSNSRSRSCFFRKYYRWSVCVYIYIIIIIINTNVIFYYSDLSRHEIVSYINIEFHHNLLLLLRILTCLKKCHKFHRSSHQTLKKYKCLHEYLIVFIFNFSTVVVFRNVEVCIASIMSTILKRYHLYISFD